MRFLKRIARLIKIFLTFLRILTSLGTRRNFLFWPMQRQLVSHLEYLNSLAFSERMSVNRKLSEAKDKANQERYKGHQRSRDYFNSQYGSLQREIQTSISGSKKTSRLLSRTFSSSFGHSAYGIGDRMKAKILGLDDTDYVLLGNHSTQSWLIERYWTNFLSYVTLDEWLLESLEVNLAHLCEDIEYLRVDGAIMGSEVAAGVIELKWQETFPSQPLLILDSEDQNYGYSRLRELGVMDVDYFITFHFRQKENERNRNVQSERYLGAIEFALAQGAHVFVIGEDVKIGSYIKHPRFLDLTYSNHRNSRLDLFLLGECRFMVGASSGPIDVPPLFGKGVLWTNCNNLVMNRWHKNSIVIPRLRVRDKVPSFQEFLTDISNGLYENDSLPSDVSDLEMVENTEDEILEGIKEMFSRDLQATPVDQEAEVHEAIRNRSGVRSNRISLSFLNKHFG